MARLITYATRKHPFKSGYRPAFLISDEYFSGVISFDGADIGQNEVRDVKIEFVSYKGKLKKGDILGFYEPPYKIGEALILEE
jgi:hypothetical protein